MDAAIGATPAEPERIRLVVADDNREVLSLLCEMLSGPFEILDAVGNGHELIRSVSEKCPDAVVSDIYMPVLNGLDASAWILDRRLCQSIVLVTTTKSLEIVRIARNLGVRGFVLKEEASEELVTAVRKVVAGENYLSAALRNADTAG